MSTINTEKIKPDFYERAFSFKNLGYLVSYYFLSNYRKIDFLIIYNANWWRSYLPVYSVEKTLEEGKELFGEKFELYYSNLKNVFKKCNEYLKAIPDSHDWFPKKEDWVGLKLILDEFYSVYEKTEFFFADAGYREESSVPAQNMKVVGEIKMEGRQILNDLLFSTLYKFTERTARFFNASVDDLKFYSYDEILNLYDAVIVRVSPETIADRKNSYVLYCKDGEIMALDKDDREIVIQNFKEKGIDGMTEFKGVIASKGVVQGIARVILANYENDYTSFQHEVDAMKQGEILITETTSPEFVPAMKKAAGIITNQGGLGSHAAIVAREFGIPCIIATGRATEIIQTGDLIEVDADNGIVRKI